MEDYKKRYEEALLQAEKELKCCGSLDCDAARQIFRLFPELKESEDDIMRKMAIHAVYSPEAQSCIKSWGINPSDVITWLEKQGNSSIKWNKNTKDCKPKVNHSVLMKTTHGIAEGEWQGEQWHQYRWAGIVRDSDVLSWIELSELEKQGEQKPADKVEPRFKVGDVIKNINNGDTVKIEQILDNYYCYSGWDGAATVHSDFSISEQDNWELVEQNPTWSEEDECILDNITVRLKQQGDAQAKVDIDWLKSLKEKMKGE